MRHRRIGAIVRWAWRPSVASLSWRRTLFPGSSIYCQQPTRARELATGTLLTPATRQQREQFLSAPDEGEGVVYGFAVTDNNRWRGHDGNVFCHIAYPFYLPSQQMALVVLLNSSVDVREGVPLMQAITGVISPDNVWPNPPPSPAATPAA